MGRRPPVEKRILDPARVRRAPAGFSWVDRRFLRDGWIERLERDEILLYLFLVCVADKHGLSYYSDARIAGTLRMRIADVVRHRARLVELGLLAYSTPLYQVLDLTPAAPRRATGGATQIGDLLRELRDR